MTVAFCGSFRTRSRLRLRSDLLEPDGVAAAYFATAQHGRVDSHVSAVVLDCGPQDARIVGEIALWKCRHHAAGAWAGDAQGDGIPDRECFPDPSIFREVLSAGRSLYDDVRTKA